MPLSLAASIGNDQNVLDEKQTITFLSRGPVVNTPDTVVNAVRYEIPRREQDSSGGFFTFQQTVFEFRVADLAVSPKEGDRITDAGLLVWAVEAAEKQVWDTVWRCEVHQERGT